MPIISNAAPDELDSPYYIANKNLCLEWEKYILEKGGLINAKYNAWSFNIKARVKTNYLWDVEVSKSTYSNGFLFFKSKYQNLHEEVCLKAIIPDLVCEDFIIKKSKFKRNKPDNQFVSKLIEVLNEGLIDKSIYEVTFQKSELTIVIHHKNDWFEMVDKILNLKS